MPLEGRLALLHEYDSRSMMAGQGAHDSSGVVAATRPEFEEAGRQFSRPASLRSLRGQTRSFSFCLLSPASEFGRFDLRATRRESSGDTRRGHESARRAGRLRSTTRWQSPYCVKDRISSLTFGTPMPVTKS